MVEDISHVIVSLLEMPVGGQSQILTRVRMDDKKRIDDAAAVLGMSQALFMRTAAINTAKEVLKTAGITTIKRAK